MGTDVSSSDIPEERGDLPFPEQAGESFPKLNHRKIPAGCEQMARIRSWGRGANRCRYVFKFLLQMNVVSENAELSAGRGLYCRMKKTLRCDSSPVKRVWKQIAPCGRGADETENTRHTVCTHRWLRSERCFRRTKDFLPLAFIVRGQGSGRGKHCERRALGRRARGGPAQVSNAGAHTAWRLLPEGRTVAGGAWDPVLPAGSLSKRRGAEGRALGPGDPTSQVAVSCPESSPWAGCFVGPESPLGLGTPWVQMTLVWSASLGLGACSLGGLGGPHPGGETLPHKGKLHLTLAVLRLSPRLLYPLWS